MTARSIEAIRLVAGDGLAATVLDWGATLADLTVPAPGGPRRVVLGYGDLDAYRENPAYLGATVGRFANRIRDGRFRLDGREIVLPRNEKGLIHLHGGAPGFAHRFWQVEERSEAAVTVRLVSPGGDQGYPGTLTARCRYELRAPGTLRIELTAETDAPTVVSLTHHSYFTLEPGRPAADHRLRIDAAAYTPMDDDALPLGTVEPVAGTPFDFTRERVVGATAGFLNANYALGLADELRPVARLTAPQGDLALEVAATEPGLQVYSAFALPETASGIGGQRHGPGAGICFEPQRYPDSPNQPAFPSAVLRPGGYYRNVTEYRFV
jgi:aldose 1-epimerase